MTFADVQHWMLGVALLVLGLVGTSGYVLVSTHAQEVSISIDNAPPQVVGGTIKVCSNAPVIPNNEAAISACTNVASIAPSAGSDRQLSLFFTVRDDNTNVDIPTSGDHQATLYHSGNANTLNASCTPDQNNCYQLTCSKAVNIAGAGDTDAWMRCDFALKYFADNSVGAEQWASRVYAEDGSGAGAESMAYTTEVAKLISGSFPVIDFGNRTQGTATTAANNLNIQHQNTGNVLLDAYVNMDDDDTNASLDCATGSLNVTNIRFDLTDQSYLNASSTLAVEPATNELNIDIQQRQNDVAPVVDDGVGDVQRTYWNASVPASGPLGFCEEELNVTFFEGP